MDEKETKCLELAERIISGMSHKEKEISLLNWIYCELQINEEYFNEMANNLLE